MPAAGRSSILEPIFGDLGQDGFAWAKHNIAAWPDFWSAASLNPSGGILWLSVMVLGAAEFSLPQKLAVPAGALLGGSGNPSKFVCAGLAQVPDGVFVSLAISKEALLRLTGHLRGAALPKALARLTHGKLPQLVFEAAHGLGMDLIKWTEELFSPPGPAFTHALYFQAKALEALSLLAGAVHETKPAGRKSALTPKDESSSAAPVSRRERMARERVAKVQALISEHLEEPLNLKELGRRVGCSPYYLSRTFSAYGGGTLQEYQRRVRLHRAAELLRDGRHNVTEAAVMVGYNSFSHFTKAFRETFGCCPGLYPLIGARQKSPLPNKY